MSDALSDIARDERRARAFGKFLDGLIDYLKEPSPKKLNQLKKLARETDAVPTGYWGGKTKLEKSFTEELLKKLLLKDETTWGKILWMSMDSYLGINKELFALSPFAEKIILFIDYGSGGRRVSIHSSHLQKIIDHAIERKRMRIYDCDEYMVALPPELLQNLKIVWVGCGILGVNGPRKPKK